MTPESIIRAKRDGEELSREAIETFVNGFVNGDVADYQMSAFLMAVVLRGMTSRETVDLTRSMASGGRRLDHSGVHARKVDKHSTGGVGDMISLPLVPLVAACGVAVPMIAGRGLGHTGGTLDKLESIPGFRTDLDAGSFTKALQRAGGIISGQTADIAPADRRMYALRDVTATVESRPLIVSSILSKKLSAGLDALVLDVKCGSGAFMTEEADALSLAQELVETAEALGLPAIAFLTDMEAPLGSAVGNAVEVASAVDCLKGQGPPDVMELVLTLGTAMLCLAGSETSWEEQWARLEHAIRSGDGLTRFATMIREQGGDASIVDHPGRLPQPGGRSDVLAPEDGYVAALDARALGRVVLELGGGRKKAEDPVDHSVGVLIHRRPGERVLCGQRLATVLGRTPQEATKAVPDVLRSYSLKHAESVRRPLVRYLVSRNDVQPWKGARSWSELELSDSLRNS